MAEDLYENRIKQGLKDLAAKFGPDAIVPANVQSVDESSFTCACITDDETIVPNVQYKTITTGSEDVVLQPAINSRVMIGRIANSDAWVIVMHGRCDKVFITANTQIIFNGGSLHGLVTRDGTKAQLNKIETDITSLKNAFNAWVPVANDGGAALKTATTAWRGAALAQTENTDIENEKIKQG